MSVRAKLFGGVHDVELVKTLAERFDVSVVPVSDSDMKGIRENAMGSPPSMRVVCDPTARVVHYNRDWVPGFEELLHEVMHVVCYLPTRDPWVGIECVDEGLLMLQVERAIARSLELHESDLRMVISWQESTVVWLDGEELQGFFEYEKDPRWRWGVRLAQKLGMLDEDERPTWALPDWSKISPYERRRLRESVATRR